MDVFEMNFLPVQRKNSYHQYREYCEYNSVSSESKKDSYITWVHAEKHIWKYLKSLT